MELYADKKWIPNKFQPGDFVFVKLRPYRQTSVAGQRVNKLSKRYYGPFKLLKKIGEVAFEVELPASSKIHPIFHVSQLKPCQNATAPSLGLPPESKDNQPIV